MKKKVDIRYKRAHIRGANIPVELIVGLGVKEVKKMYPWLKNDQIEDAIDYVNLEGYKIWYLKDGKKLKKEYKW